MKKCKSFIGKNIVIVDIKRIVDDTGSRTTEIYELLLNVNREWGKSYKAGQFVILKIDEKGERIPLTIADYDSGVLKMIFQVMGASTKKLSKLKPGNTIEDLTYPLGIPLDIPKERSKIIIVVAGGVGIAAAYPKVKALSEAGHNIITLLGTRNKNTLFMLDEMKKYSKVIVTTDDGSYDDKDAAVINGNRKLFGIDVLKELFKGNEVNKIKVNVSDINEVIVVGPPIMMKFVALETKKKKIKTIASLNSTMVDGSGMCGGCKVSINNKIAYTCKDGPIFNAHEIDWDLVLKRANRYLDHEKLSNDLLDNKQKFILNNEYLKKLAKYLNLPSVKVKEITEGMEKKFSHKAGYLTLKKAIKEANTCICKHIETQCKRECPVEINIQQFINFLKNIDPKNIEDTDKKIYESFKVLKSSNPIPEITGLVCPQETQCQSTCIKAIKGKATEIGKLEAFVAMWIRTNIERIRKYRWYEKEEKQNKQTNKKIMIIGSGPAGLVAAAELAKKGHDITIFETLHEPGGVLIYGIPEFRLPKEIVRYEISKIAELGVKFEVNHPIKDIKEHKFDAAFITTGAGTPSFLNIPGEQFLGVYSANEFLTRINLMKGYLFPLYDTPIPEVIDKKVIVFGAGNTAMDAARCALRLGAKKTTILYRRNEKEVPARHEEFLAAKDEGINFKFLTTPIEFIGEEGSLKGVNYYKNKLGKPDSSGRKKPIPIKDKTYFEKADFAVIAIGQSPNKMMDISEFKLDKRGRIIVNNNKETSIKNVFAGGDIISGNQGTVIYAAGCGLKAAKEIDEKLNNLN